jgi:hypothetical protein
MFIASMVSKLTAVDTTHSRQEWANTIIGTILTENVHAYAAAGCSITYAFPSNASAANIGTWTLTRHNMRVFAAEEVKLLGVGLLEHSLCVHSWNPDKVVIGAFNGTAFVKVIMRIGLKETLLRNLLQYVAPCPENVNAIATSAELRGMRSVFNTVAAVRLLQDAFFRHAASASVVTADVWEGIQGQHRRWSDYRAAFIGAIVSLTA